VDGALQRWFACAVVALLAGCGGSGGSEGGQVQGPRGVRLVVDTTVPFVRAPDFQARLENTVDAALQYWGGTWSDVDGRTVTLVDSQYVDCNGVSSLGCFDGNIRFTTRDPGMGEFACVEATVLVHEIGHAVIGDPNHTDPRWMQMDALAAELSGRTGYTADGEEPCTTYVSVWRHPLDSP
jgi:hypothetical protein